MINLFGGVGQKSTSKVHAKCPSDFRCSSTRGSVGAAAGGWDEWAAPNSWHEDGSEDVFMAIVWSRPPCMKRKASCSWVISRAKSPLERFVSQGRGLAKFTKVVV